LRVGLVTAAAICDACAIPAYGVCSLDAIAVVASAPAAAGPVGLADPNDPGAPLLVAADARRKEVYWARYVDGVRQDGPAVARPADLAAHLDAVAMAGAGARLYRDVLGLPLLDADHPTVLGLAELAADRIRAGAPSEPLTPLYLRRPDAVAPAALKLVSQR
jgi:tRNA threonylcarbamoyl adenosine modification protein YeaZ